MAVFDRILVATDFGDAATSALARAVEMARAFGSRLFVLHVVDDISTYFKAPEYAAAIGKLQGDLEASARERMKALLAGYGVGALDVETAVVTSDAPDSAILSYSRDKNADLIVMGTHGRGKIASLLLGSVAEKILRSAPCPVLVVRELRHAAAPESAAATALSA